MSAAEQRALRKAIQEHAFERAYYFYGDDDFLKEAAVRDLIASAVDPSTRAFNLEVRRGNELDGETLGSLLGTPPMMADRRMVVVRDALTLKKDARGALDRYLKKSAADTVVVLVTPAGVKPDKLLLASTFPIAFDPLSGDRVPKWIAHHVTTELHTTITPGAIDLLISAVGSDLPQLAAELDKLASYSLGAEITESAVSEVVGVRRGETLGDLLDAVAQRNAARALDLVGLVLAQPKTTLVSVIMALSTQTLAIAWGRAARDRGLPQSALEREYLALLKETSAFPMRPWGQAASCWARAVAKWDAIGLDRALDQLLAADWAAKESKVSSEEQMLGTLILTLCASAHRAAA